MVTFKYSFKSENNGQTFFIWNTVKRDSLHAFVCSFQRSHVISLICRRNHHRLMRYTHQGQGLPNNILSYYRQNNTIFTANKINRPICHVLHYCIPKTWPDAVNLLSSFYEIHLTPWTTDKLWHGLNLHTGQVVFNFFVVLLHNS